MNCPKCGSPLNPGDKFCQVCGSAVENVNPVQPPQPTPPVAPNPMPATQPAPVVQPAPAVNPAPASPVPPTEPKKGNTLVVVLVAIIAILVVVIVAILFLGKNDKDSKGSGNNGGGGTTVAKVDTPQYNEVSVGAYKFKLLSGYSVENTADGVVLSNATGTSQALFGHLDGYSVSDIDAVALASEFQTRGFVATSSEKTIEGKKGLLFTGTYSGFDYEVLYVQENSMNPRIIYADIAYNTPADKTKDAENIYKMIALTEVREQSTQSQTSKIIKLAPSVKK
ncbi:MAG: zinc ribbon domain-containing protein [Bacilli bacterium]|nr:zinc ribbon domain-containing protein [Bacilli bacterium]